MTLIAILWDGVSDPLMGLLLDRGSALEDRLCAEMKRRNIPAERQEHVQVNDTMYALDFARYCNSGKIEAETDGDRWHANPERAKSDHQRDDDLTTAGWKQLRFNTHHVCEQMAELPTQRPSTRWGGLEAAPKRSMDLDNPEAVQRDLFDG